MGPRGSNQPIAFLPLPFHCLISESWLIAIIDGLIVILHLLIKKNNPIKDCVYNKHMRIIVLYRPNSEHARIVEDYITDFNRFHPNEAIEIINIDSPQGANLAEIYGVMIHPAIIAVKNDGQMQQIWEGQDKLPLMNDLAYFAQQ